MKKLIAAGSMLLLAYTSGAQSAAQKIDSVMNYYAETFAFNGDALVLLKGKTLLHRGYGYKDQSRKLKNNGDGIFMIGSITKQFTAELILMLAKEGRLQLDDTVSKYFPDLREGKRITIDQLLSHTSGLYNYTDDTTWHEHPEAMLSQQQMMAIFKDKPLEFEPGSKFGYSNSNYILLTYIIEQLSGKPYDVVARERILQPLGMRHTGFDFTHLKDPAKVTGYDQVLQDSFYTAKICDSTQSLGAGALYSTTADLYKWHRALQSFQLLDKEWQYKAYVPHKKGYAYGWFVTDDLFGKKALAHSGGIEGFYTYFLRLEAEDLCIVLFSNVRYNGADNNAIAVSMVRSLYDTAYHIPKPRRAIKLSRQQMTAYAGTYVLAADTSVALSFRVDGQRFLCTVTGQAEDRIYPESDHFFFARTADAQFEFVRDEQHGYKLLLHQHGQVFEAGKKM